MTARNPDTKGARTRARILDAAAAVVRRQGYAATSLGDIATAAGLRTGSLYFHFRTKDELVEAMLAQGVELTLEQVRAAVQELGPDAMPAARVRAAVEAHLAALGAQSDYAGAVLRTIDQFPPRTRRHFQRRDRAYRRYWQELLADAVAPGELDTELAAALLIGALNSTWRAAPRSAAADARVAETLLTLVGLSDQS